MPAGYLKKKLVKITFPIFDQMKNAKNTLKYCIIDIRVACVFVPFVI